MSTKTHVMALDAGTSSVRAILFDHSGQVSGIAQEEFSQFYPEPGWVEHDAVEIWETTVRVMHQVLTETGISPESIAAIGITNQRETSLVWEKTSGRPIYNALVWQDGRTAEYCDEIRMQGWSDYVKEATGLPVDAYFSGTKAKWILDNAPDARNRAVNGELLWGTIDTWLIWNLTAGKAHVTDFSNASRTLMFNIRTRTWDDKLVELFDIPRELLPEVKPSSEVYGWAGANAGFDTEIPVAAAIGDQQGALFGQTCFSPGDAKATYGTGGSVMMNTGTEPIESNSGLLTTIAWGFDNSVEYALEGLLFSVGAPLKWLRDELRLIDDVRSTESMAEEIDSTGGVYLVPAFTGLASPYWDQYARGAILGMTPGTGRSELVRAALEAIGYSFRDVFEKMQEESGIPLPELKVDGGAVSNNFLLQFQADQLGVPVLRPAVTESTARGAAFLAGLATGFWASQDEVKDSLAIERRFVPRATEAERNELYLGWQKAVSRALAWAES